MPGLESLNFVDLYLGEGYADFKGMEGAHQVRTPVPDDVAEQVQQVRETCEKAFRIHEEPEFSIIHGEVLFRVTQMSDVLGSDVFVLRRSTAEIRPYQTIGIGPKVTDFALSKEARGLILVIGEMVSGKTTTIASLFKERLSRHGGVGVAIEDPPETRLDGVHGLGRCLQIPASRKSGGYREQLVRAMRSGADAILLGEIRDEETAFQVVQAGLNGHLIYSTMHAGGIVQGLERLAGWCSLRSEGGNTLLADGLSAIVHQQLQRVPRQGGAGFTYRMLSKALMLSDEDGTSIRAKIREGKFHLVAQEVDEQARKNLWGGRPSGA